MNNKNRIDPKKVLSVLLGIIFAVMMSAPYIFYREQIQQMALVGYLSVVIACAISNISILLPSSSTLIVVAAASSLNPILCVMAGVWEPHWENNHHIFVVGLEEEDLTIMEKKRRKC